MTAANPPGRLFCFGLGYSAIRLARGLADAGWTVAGTCRTAAKCAVLRGTGIEARPFDGTMPDEAVARAVAAATHILSSVPPDDAGDPVLRHFAGAIAGAAELRWAGYLSTTGVYGDRDGGWVDETSALIPTGARGRRRQAAEAEWLALHLAHGVAVHIFRLAGIYGPGRSALDQLRNGTARRIVKPGHVFSRIHVDDIAAVLRASMARPDGGAVYNVCDDFAAPSSEVVAHACRLLGVAAPPEILFAAAGLSEMAQSFYADNKRVRNDRIKRELGIVLRFPDYRAGLSALAAGEDDFPEI